MSDIEVLPPKKMILGKLAAPTASYVAAGRPRVPKILTTEGKKIFRALCRLLEERQVLTAADGELIALYANTRVRYESAVRHIAEEGEIVVRERTSKDGQVHTIEVENSWLKIGERAEKTMLAILTQLGLSPVSRDRVKIAKGNGNSEENEVTSIRISLTKVVTP